jgi:hypothetical protein
MCPPPPLSPGDCTAPTNARRLNPLSPYSITDMEESGEYCTVVFASIWLEGGGVSQSPLSKQTHVYDSLTINAKTTVPCTHKLESFQKPNS